MNWGIIKLEDVRSLLRSKHEELFEPLGKTRPYERLLANKAKNTSFEQVQIKKTINDFYLTDSISRFSKTMAECSQVRKDLRSGTSSYD